MKIATVIAAKNERPALTAKASKVVSLIKSPPELHKRTANNTKIVGGKFEIRFEILFTKLSVSEFTKPEN